MPGEKFPTVHRTAKQPALSAEHFFERFGVHGKEILLAQQYAVAERLFAFLNITLKEVLGG